MTKAASKKGEKVALAAPELTKTASKEAKPKAATVGAKGALTLDELKADANANFIYV